jgi:hypothetical protein
MSDSVNYTLWYAQEMKKLIDLIAKKASTEELKPQITEIHRGSEYATNYPGSIDELLLKLGRNLVDSLQVYLRQMRTKSKTGIPPGGQPTILTGGEAMDALEIPTDSNTDFSVDELKGALANRKKKAVESKMKGSIDLLKEYDES